MMYIVVAETMECNVGKSNGNIPFAVNRIPLLITCMTKRRISLSQQWCKSGRNSNLYNIARSFLDSVQVK
jgi:hypothetical protein